MAPLDLVMAAGVACSAGQGVEEEPGYGHYHCHGFSCSANFASVATRGPGHHLQH